MDIIGQTDAARIEHRESQKYDASEALEMAQIGERMPRVSLKQWRLFHAVIDNDGYVGAANKLHVSQSSISHALAKLQDQLGVPLLTLKGRKAQITKEGRMLLARSRDLLRRAGQLEKLGEFLRLGAEPEIRLVVEPNYPADLLIRTFNDLSSQFASLRLDVKETGFAEIRKLMHQDEADIAISTGTMAGFASNKLIELEHIAIAPADSPLFRINRGITQEDLAHCLQIMFCAGSQDTEPLGAGCSAQGLPAWRVSSLDSAADALRFGLGYAWLPRYRVQGWLNDGWVRILPLDSGSSYTVQMYLTRGRAVIPGSSAQRFADVLQAVTNQHAARPGSRPICDVAPTMYNMSCRSRETD
jgi:DNA-binding transcriptional LysR family regulator